MLVDARQQRRQARCRSRRAGLALTDDEVALVRLTAELHDIGKTAIPDAILNKPGPLDDDEWTFIRRHTRDRRAHPRCRTGTRPDRTLVRATHERFDGTGYPDRLNQERSRSPRGSSPSSTPTTR